MAQGLTRDLKTANVVAEFLPSKSRYFSQVILASAVGGLISLVIFYFAFGDVALGAPLGVIVIMLLKEYFTYTRYKIVITDDAISGPSASGGNTITIALGQIDRLKTRRTKWSNKIGGSRLIYSVSGDRLILSSMDFDQNQISTILDKIGCKAKR